jgi:hypothetical protein
MQIGIVGLNFSRAQNQLPIWDRSKSSNMGPFRIMEAVRRTISGTLVPVYRDIRHREAVAGYID